MPYVERNPDESIKGIYARPQPGFAEEFVANPVLPPTPLPLDQDVLNAVLAEEGSVVRALAEVMLLEINKLRVKTGDVAYTKAQFVASLKAKMRT